MPAHIAPAPVRVLHHEVHYIVRREAKVLYRAFAMIAAPHVEAAEAIFRAEVPIPAEAEAKIIKVIVPRILL